MNLSKAKQDTMEAAQIQGHSLLWNTRKSVDDDVPLPGGQADAFCTLCGDVIWIDINDNPQVQSQLAAKCGKQLFNRLDETTKGKIARQMREA